MPQRRTLCSRPRRDPMDKSIADKSRNRLWFVIFMSFVCWFLILLYFHRTYSREFSFSILGNYVDNAEQLSVLEKERVGNGIANYEIDNVDQLERENGIDSEASIVARKGAKQNESDAMPIVKIGNESSMIQDDAGESKQDVEKEKNGNGDSDIVEAANMKDIFAFVETMQPENRTKIEKQHISEVVVKKKRGRKRRSNNAKNKAVAAEKKDDGSWKMVVESQQKPREASPSPPPPLPPPPPPKPGDDTVWLKVVFSTPQRDVDCSGRYIYIHDIPSRFNGDLLKNCDKIARWTDMCEFLSHMGLGPRLPNPQKIFSNTGWYATNQFSLEVIFHNRMKQYECLTKNSSLASAIYVPFYAGLDVSQYLWCCNNTARDSAPHSLVKWLRDQPEWNVMGGRDHFMVEGRICWDFRRPTDKKSDWGSILLHLPEVKNMTNLVIESSPWNSSDHAIPYPTYFHPSTDGEVLQWQDRMRRLKRDNLFSFAGAPRPGRPDTVRNEILKQCRASVRRKKCRLLECTIGRSNCHKPVDLMKLFQSSTFCLQPPGDSYTRRSTFDSILAGCIPVFFHPGSAYVQYLWHLPKNFTKYSVFIPANEVKGGNTSIETTLTNISQQQIVAMREEVIKLIPKVIYADPRTRLETQEDAFDLTIKGVLERVEKFRSKVFEGKDPMFGEPDEQLTWKYNLFGTQGTHEWDHFFSSRLLK